MEAHVTAVDRQSLKPRSACETYGGRAHALQCQRIVAIATIEGDAAGGDAIAGRTVENEAVIAAVSVEDQGRDGGGGDGVTREPATVAQPDLEVVSAALEVVVVGGGGTGVHGGNDAHAGRAAGRATGGGNGERAAALARGEGSARRDGAAPCAPTEARWHRLPKLI